MKAVEYGIKDPFIRYIGEFGIKEVLKEVKKEYRLSIEMNLPECALCYDAENDNKIKRMIRESKRLYKRLKKLEEELKRQKEEDERVKKISRDLELKRIAPAGI